MSSRIKTGVVVTLMLCLATFGAALAQVSGGFQDCEWEQFVIPLPAPCLFSGFLNTPINSTLYLDQPVDGNLIVCMYEQPPGTEFGVRWETFGRTGHNEWDDIGFSAWGKIDAPGSLGGASMRVESNASWDIGGGISQRSVTALMADTGTTVDISVDFAPVGAATVRMEVYASLADEQAHITASAVGGLDPSTAAAVAADWPILTEMSRFLFGDDPDTLVLTDITLPGQTTVQGVVLAVIPEGPGLGQITSKAKMTQTATNIKQSSLETAICPNNDKFTLLYEGVGMVPQPFPTLNDWGVVMLVVLLLTGGTYYLSRRRRA